MQCSWHTIIFSVDLFSDVYVMYLQVSSYVRMLPITILGRPGLKSVCIKCTFMAFNGTTINLSQLRNTDTYIAMHMHVHGSHLRIALIDSSVWMVYSGNWLVLWLRSN